MQSQTGDSFFKGTKPAARTKIPGMSTLHGKPEALEEYKEKIKDQIAESSHMDVNQAATATPMDVDQKKSDSDTDDEMDYLQLKD